MNYIKTLKKMMKHPKSAWTDIKLILYMRDAYPLWLELAEALERIDLKTIPCDPIFQEDCPSCNLKQALAKLKGEE